MFDIKRGSGVYTKKYVQDHQGSYPLFSDNTFGTFAQIDSFDFDVVSLSWAIDGLAGSIMHHESPFSATNHRSVLIPKKQHVDQIDLECVQCVLEPLFRELKKDVRVKMGKMSTPLFLHI